MGKLEAWEEETFEYQKKRADDLENQLLVAKQRCAGLSYIVDELAKQLPHLHDLVSEAKYFPGEGGRN